MKYFDHDPSAELCSTGQFADTVYSVRKFPHFDCKKKSNLSIILFPTSNLYDDCMTVSVMSTITYYIYYVYYVMLRMYSHNITYLITCK